MLGFSAISETPISALPSAPAPASTAALSTITIPATTPPVVRGNTAGVGVHPGRSSITVRTPGTATVRYTSKERP